MHATDAVKSGAALTNAILCQRCDVSRPCSGRCGVNARISIAKIILKDRDDVRPRRSGQGHADSNHHAQRHLSHNLSAVGLAGIRAITI